MNYNSIVHFFTKKYTIRRTVMINTLKDFIEIVQDNTRQNFNYGNTAQSDNGNDI